MKKILATIALTAALLGGGAAPNVAEAHGAYYTVSMVRVYQSGNCYANAGAFRVPVYGWRCTAAKYGQYKYVTIRFSSTDGWHADY